MDVSENVKRDLGDLIDFLRTKGVLHFSMDGLTLALMPDQPARGEVSAPEKTDLSPPKRGRDGLTREEQIETYGRQMDLDI